ncbi:MAG: hypothetical protein P8181_09150, partial [bacterium]
EMQNMMGNKEMMGKSNTKENLSQMQNCMGSMTQCMGNMATNLEQMQKDQMGMGQAQGSSGMKTK